MAQSPDASPSSVIHPAHGDEITALTVLNMDSCGGRREIQESLMKTAEVYLAMGNLCLGLDERCRPFQF